MKPYMASLVTEENHILFQKISQIIEALPDIDLGKDAKGRKVLVSCHMIVRGLARIFTEVERHDGYFGKIMGHSWLTIKSDSRLIIDPYPVALIGGPIMVHSGFFTVPWNRLYIEARLPYIGGQEFRRHVGVVTRALKKNREGIVLQANASATN